MHRGSSKRWIFDIEAIDHFSRTFGDLDRSHLAPNVVHAVDRELASLELWQQLRELGRTSNAVVISTPHRRHFEALEESWYSGERAAMLSSFMIWPQFEQRGLLPGMSQVMKILKGRDNEVSQFGYDYQVPSQGFRSVFPKWDSFAAQDFQWYCEQDVYTTYNPRPNCITEAIRARFGTTRSCREEAPTSHGAQQEWLINFRHPSSQSARETMLTDFLSATQVSKLTIAQLVQPLWEQQQRLVVPVPKLQAVSTLTTNRSCHQLTANYSSRSRAGKMNRYC